MRENEILTELTYASEEGALRYKGVRYLLIRPETLISLQKALEDKIGLPEAAELLYAGGFTGGQLSGRKYKQTFGLSDRQAVEFMCRMGGQIGWGHFHLLEMDSARRRLVVEVGASPFAEAYGPGESGVCHLIRGVLGGLGSGIFGRLVEARETQCLALGDGACHFEVRSLT